MTTPQQQREFAKARKARKKSQKEQADKMPPKSQGQPSLPNIPESLIALINDIAGEGEAQKAMRIVAAKREIFLKAVEGTGAVQSFDGRRMTVDTSLLNPKQLELLRSYAGEGL